jgi:hypothetical protein
VSVLVSPCPCLSPSNATEGTVWQCEDCGSLRQIWFFMNLPVGPFRRWRLRRQGLLPIPPECDYCPLPSVPALSTEDENVCAECATPSPSQGGGTDG